MKKSHNPYFNRWFSAIAKQVLQSYLKNCHNPYFNRWFSAIKKLLSLKNRRCHNPYFNRWFSAITLTGVNHTLIKLSQSLF